MDIDRGPWRRVGEGAGLLQPDGSIAATVFAEMSALAARTGAINLGQGFPDEDGPREVLDAAREAISAGRNQYPPGRGTPELLEAIARHQRRFYGLDLDPTTQVLVTAGATEALAASILALTEPGDEIVTFEPYYDAYAGLVALSGATLVTVPLRWPDFAPDHDELRAAVSDRTRIILVNDPHNPTGTTFDAATRDLIVELAHRHDALILTDEVYEHLTFGAPHVPISTLPGAAERTITVSSAGKTFNTTGWKIGWLVGPAALVSAILTIKQYLTYVSGSPFQPAIAHGLGLPDATYDRIASNLREKRDVLTRGLQAAGFDVSIPAGSYFTVVDVSPLGFDDGARFCAELPALSGVVGVPVTAFASTLHRSSYRSLVRFAFCKRLDVLEEASARLAAIGGRSSR